MPPSPGPVSRSGFVRTTGQCADRCFAPSSGLAIENKKASTNPARLLKRKREDNGRFRFLNQLAPAKSEVEYLKPHADEESRLRAVILSDYPYHMPEFEIALHTGMRRANNMV
jgi:hypothetical protein